MQTFFPFLVAMGVLVFGAVMWKSAQDTPKPVLDAPKTELESSKPVLSNAVRITGGQSPVTAELADTPEERQKGLSGRMELLPNTGMLFVFDQPGRYGFWMPDMRFSIDILWIDASFRVVHIASDVPPESYPRLYTPEKEASYVLELTAGDALRLKIATGTQLHLNKD